MSQGGTTVFVSYFALRLSQLQPHLGTVHEMIIPHAHLPSLVGHLSFILFKGPNEVVSI